MIAFQGSAIKHENQAAVNSYEMSEYYIHLMRLQCPNAVDEPECIHINMQLRCVDGEVRMIPTGLYTYKWE